MVFIGNRGYLQIHTGLVHNIKMFGTEWLNVLDDEFSMHVRDSAVVPPGSCESPRLTEMSPLLSFSTARATRS